MYRHSARVSFGNLGYVVLSKPARPLSRDIAEQEAGKRACTHHDCEWYPLLAHLSFCHYISPMQEPILSPTLTRRIYAQRGIMIASLLASPLAFGFLMTKNCRALEQRAKIKQAWLLSIGALVVVLALAYVLPESVPTFPFLFLNAAFGYYAPQYLLGKEMEEHVANGGPLYSNWRAAGIALLVVVVLVAVCLLAFAAMDVQAIGGR